MDSAKKSIGSSSSSFTNDLFGSNDSSSSYGIFGSIFPPTKVMGKDIEFNGKRPDNNSQRNKISDDQSSRNKILDAIFEGDRGRVDQPCNLCSSIYYGGQDLYYTPPTSRSSSSYKKGVQDDDPHTASRGDWWQGSFYY